MHGSCRNHRKVLYDPYRKVQDSMRKKEYGGYLPLETKIDEDYFSKYGSDHVVRTNSAKAAIYFAVQKMKPTKLYVPYYMCNSVLHMLAGSGVCVEKYWLNDELLPALEKTDLKEENTQTIGILLVNYFGVMDQKISQLVGQYKNVIIDNSHAFFCPPILREDVYNVYSCRKFVGVPDGGYLVSKTQLSLELEPDRIGYHFSYLVISPEYSMNEAYTEKIESDKYFYDNYKGMSRISQGLLSSVDYEFIKQKREENFNMLHGQLKAYNQFLIEGNNTAPYLYPFRPKKNYKGNTIDVAALKKSLVAQKIYTPTLWRELITSEYEETLEYQISKNTVFLPIDQRYDVQDMEYLAQTVLTLSGICDSNEGVNTNEKH